MTNNVKERDVESLSFFVAHTHSKGPKKNRQHPILRCRLQLFYCKDRCDICPFRDVFVMRWALSIVLAVKDFPSVFKPLLQISLIAGVRAVNPFKVVGCTVPVVVVLMQDDRIT